MADEPLAAVIDVEEERIQRRWLNNQEVKQAEAREAGQRQRDRIAAEMEEAGQPADLGQVGELSRQIYKTMSRASHHRREAVDEAVDHASRSMIYGPDPREGRVLDFVISAGQLIHEILLHVGDALSTLYGRGFFEAQVQPMFRRFEEMLTALDVVEKARALGLGR